MGSEPVLASHLPSLGEVGEEVHSRVPQQYRGDDGSRSTKEPRSLWLHGIAKQEGGESEGKKKCERRNDDIHGNSKGVKLADRTCNNSTFSSFSQPFHPRKIHNCPHRL